MKHQGRKITGQSVDVPAQKASHIETVAVAFTHVILLASGLAVKDAVEEGDCFCCAEERSKPRVLRRLS